MSNAFGHVVGRGVTKQATPGTQYVGDLTLSRRKKYRARLYLVRAYKPCVGRPAKRKCKKQGNSSLYRKLHKAPWVLATSLHHSRLTRRRVKQLYATRMQIEQTLRDTKCHRWGLSLRYAGSRDGKRLEILLLIGAPALLLQWLFGLHGRRHGLSRHFQANTERRRSVLSVVFVGTQIIQRLRFFPICFDELAPLLEMIVKTRAAVGLRHVGRFSPSPNRFPNPRQLFCFDPGLER